MDQEPETLEGTIPQQPSAELGDSPRPALPGCPGYRLVELLGQGGFGSVYRAWKKAPPHGEAALKILKPGHQSVEILARFALERQALALMDHPAIARFLDAGSTSDGRPFFVMELVRGKPITNHCRDARLPLADRLRIFAGVCLAVHHAHQKGVLHRDIKPSNVLVSVVNGSAEPKVIDFGIARAVSPEADLPPSLTQSLQLVGTLLYMSPEQASGRGNLDTRSDIYALGVLLYELLTGAPPFAHDKKQLTPQFFLRCLHETAPPRPSAALRVARDTTRETGRRDTPSLRELFGPAQVRGDLDWIVMKALEKDPERRYPSAAAFADDIRRHLDSLPVQAGPPDPAYRARKFFLRHRRPAAAAAAILAATLFGSVFSALQWSRAAEGARNEQSVKSALEASRKDSDRARVQIEETIRFAFQDLERQLDQPGETAVLTDLGAQAWDYLRLAPAPDSPSERTDLARTLLALARVHSVDSASPEVAEICFRASEVLGPHQSGELEPQETGLLRANIALEGARAGSGSSETLDAVMNSLSDLAPAESAEAPFVAAFSNICRDARKLAFAAGDLPAAERAATLESEAWDRHRNPLAIVSGEPDPAVLPYARALAQLAAVRQERGDGAARETARAALELAERALLTTERDGEESPDARELHDWAEILWEGHAVLARGCEGQDPEEAAALWLRAADAVSVLGVTSVALREKQARALHTAGRLLASLGEAGEAQAAWLEGKRILRDAQRRGAFPPEQQELLHVLEAQLQTHPGPFDEPGES